MSTPRKRSPARKTGGRLSHIDAAGNVRMVDVGGKRVTRREAVARGAITIAPEALQLIRSGRIAKGDPLQAARLAGIMAAKRTGAPITSVSFRSYPTHNQLLVLILIRKGSSMSKAYFPV